MHRCMVDEHSLYDPLYEDPCYCTHCISLEIPAFHSYRHSAYELILPPSRRLSASTEHRTLGEFPWRVRSPWRRIYPR
jgi:hypothetical protein